ncbi:Alpha/beta hydrolase fold-1 [Bisporella sp. PMI_857]|nr:Alpha/beta hydrolase fold-1 [Bisporella sp. PMI_857]
MSKPTLVLVPGAWHTAATWDKVKALLEKEAYKAIAVTLPSTLGNQNVTFLDDITAVRDAVTGETSQGRDVVVVVHSYGGAVGQSAIKGLTKPEEGAQEGAKGHVVGLVSMASGFGPTGLSFIDGLGGKPPPSWEADNETGFANIVVDARDLFYHDLPDEEGKEWVHRLTKQAIKPLFEGGEWAYAGWQDVPVWYLGTSDDHALPFEAQRMMVEYARANGGNVEWGEVASSHSPMLSKPQEVVDFVVKAVNAFVK